ncbi:sterol desaturase family protein [Cronobacter sakazakii]|uniref:sterol desaturase family protein n=1 Tax=Cronobacter sakazakii TaxID=28141 RepID=UPI000B4B9169|nr:sterol desaturase family protein [Cronobacter sakazakii]EJQ2005835.1 sterol desaturase family protein [Cronobacter sakazakii]EJQ2087171.1 sterol desaturase family protein [Cronobacter sakazakii]EJR9308833.1 sterol desaturase family protein [Cronobacter sakazakii]EJR9313516.1 sterol desaturase family protein [Cronobacter sakazakii]EJR9318092.1 sterol desaturase family protein [Cronobacter sakazakii]
MNELTLPIVVMLGMVFGEALLLKWRARAPVNWRDIVFNVNSGQMMLWLFRGLEVLCYSVISRNVNLELFQGAPAVVMWGFAFIAWDFGFYWLHRLHHEWPLLWAVHSVHHHGEHYNLSLGVRNSWYSSLTSIPFFMLLAVAGVPLSVFLAVSVIHYSIQFFNHNAFTGRLGFLERLLVTPSHHRVHHLCERRFADTNYGGTLILWDKLFGSFCHTPPTRDEHQYGVKGYRASANPLRESNAPFARLLGFRPAPHTKGSVRPAPYIIVSGTLLLFIPVIGYIQRYGYGYDDIGREQMTLFLLLVAASVMMGLMNDGHRASRIGWAVVTGLMPLCCLHLFGWQGLIWQLSLPALALHGLIVLAMPVMQKRALRHD